jgi:hypothetical protein
MICLCQSGFGQWAWMHWLLESVKEIMPAGATALPVAAAHSVLDPIPALFLDRGRNGT